MDTEKTLAQVADNIETVIKQDSPLGVLLWQEFIKLHPADIAQFFQSWTRNQSNQLFKKFPHALKAHVFSYLSYSMKVYCLSFLDGHDRAHLLSALPLDELTDFFDELSDEELKNYLKLLHKKDREKVLSLMQFDPESAGGIMNTDVITLMAILLSRRVFKFCNDCSQVLNCISRFMLLTKTMNWLGISI